MDRRNFTAISLATLLAPLPRISLAEQIKPELPGFQEAEIKDNRLSKRSAGMATGRTLVDDETLFQVASCSKTVTALAILTLVRDGKIDLDQPANKYLTQWQLAGSRGALATIAELMSHTAGTTVSGFGGYGPDEEIPNLIDILSGRHPANSGAVRARRRLFGQFKYSGGGTMVLQALIEDVTGQDFATYTKSAVLNPIGSPNATFSMRPEAAFAHGYHEDGHPLRGGYRRHPESAAAGLWATASDLARVMQAILDALKGESNAIIPIPLAKRMVSPLSRQSALGVFVSPNNTIWHHGRNHGFDSVMVADLNSGRIRTAVTNRNGAIESYARQLVPD